MIQWFPGHMMKAKKEMAEILRLIDIVIELIDARIPQSSQNPLFHDIVKNKPRLLLLTKSMLADDAMTKSWIKVYEQEGNPCFMIDSISGFNINRIASFSREILKDKIEHDRARGLKDRPMRAMVIGVPNVGKSTFINSLVKKKVSAVGNRPGVTKAQQWIRINKDFELLDTPGVLWPKFEDQTQGYHLALTGAIRDEVLKKEDLVLYLLDYLKTFYPTYLQKYMECQDLSEPHLIDQFGRRMGIGEEDTDRIYEIILKDFRAGVIGRISLDRVKHE
ncbi:MAG: ribosome biogenesis GTPase YlqF [Bacilli bacterium]|nr:ribosome biogenesis GTPase YlqF [Bacilli bacterium]